MSKFKFKGQGHQEKGKNSYNLVCKICSEFCNSHIRARIYCHVPARWGLEQTTLGSGQRQDTGSGILCSVHRRTRKFFKRETNGTFDPFLLLRQVEPGTSQYIFISIFFFFFFFCMSGMAFHS